MGTAGHRPVRRAARRPVADDRLAPEAAGGLPLTPPERRAWFLGRWAPGTALDRGVALVRLRDPADAAVLRAGLAVLLAAHPHLRARYAEAAGGPVRLPAPAGRPVDVPVDDLVAVSTQATVGGLTEEALAAPLDPVRGPLVRVTLAADAQLLALTVHRLAADPAGTEILLDELVRAVTESPAAESGVTESPATAAEPATESPAAAMEPATESPVTAAEPAAGELAAVPGVGSLRPAANRPDGEPVSVAADTRAPVVRTWATATVSRALAAPLGLDRLAAALAVVLARYSGRDDIALGTPSTVPPDRPANPLVIRIDVRGNPTAAALLDRSRAALRAAEETAAIPFDQLVAELAPARDPAGHPLFRVTAEVRDRRGRGAAEPVTAPAGAALVDVAVRVVLGPGGAELVAEYATELFARDRLVRMLDHLAEVAGVALAEPSRRLGDLPLLTAAERDRILHGWNDTATPARDDARCVHDLVRDWAQRTPDAPACRDAGVTVGYRELVERADRLSARLRELGAGPEELVAVVVDRGVELPVALLGVLGAGAGYLPMDPTHPAARLAEQVADAGCRVAVVAERYAGLLPSGLALVAPDATVLAAGAARPARHGAPTADNLAYVIFTSGSTGRPKGAMVAHRSVVNYVFYTRVRLGLGPGDRVLQFANPCFDVSVFDIFCTLGNGATLVHVPRAQLVDPRALTAALVAERVTVADIPPTIAAVLDPAAFPLLRRLGLGGEVVSGELVRRWRTEHRAVYNIYGPTETTVTATDFACPLDGSAANPAIGRPIANFTVYVVDRYGQPVPVGVPGELLIGGLGVARGYLGRPGLTAERFGPDPFGPPGARVYRTGDLVRWRADGMLEFDGRVDRQVKLRGQRIEPGEVEAGLLAHPDVESVAVQARGGDLVAYLVAGPGRPVPDLGAVRAFLQDRLPGYLIPTAVVPLPALPLTRNGKVDLRALPDPRPARAPAPSDSVLGAALARLWRRLLDVEQVGPDDDFFACGGHSLLAVELARQVERTVGVAIALPAFWAEPTFAALVRAASRSAG